MKKIISLLFLLALCAASPALANDEIVSFNTASVEELVAIEWIDIPEELAQAIVDYRTANGPFRSPEEMAKVPGMTVDYLEELNPQLTDDKDIVFDPDAEPALAPSKC